MEQADLGHVARIVAKDRQFSPTYAASDGSMYRIPWKRTAIGPDFAKFGDRQQQQVELLQRFRHARDEPPCCQRTCGGILDSPCGRAW